MSRSIQELMLLPSRANAAGTIVANHRNHRSDGGERMPLLSASDPERPKGEKRMDPLKVSAMFAAYVWFTERNEGTATAEKEAVSFARDNWQAFLPCAHKGLGRLLTRIAGVRSQRGRCARSRGAVIVG
jgi:hypothetical protein